MKKTSKKIFAGMLAVGMLAAATALPAIAANDTTENITEADSDGYTTVSYSKDNTYTVSIPSTLTLSETETKTCAITASAMNIVPGKCLNVSVTPTYVNLHDDDTAATVTLKNMADNGVQAITTLTGGAEYATNITKTNPVVAQFAGMSTEPTSADQIKGMLRFSALTNADTTKTAVQAGIYSATIDFYFVIDE